MKLSEIPLELIFYVVGLIAFIITWLLKGLGSVPEGERGVKCRWGKALRKKDGNFDIREPGLVLLWPFVDTLVKRHVRQQTLNLVDQKVTLADGFVYTVSTVIAFKIVDVYKALFDIDKLDQSIENVALIVVQEQLNQRTYGDLLNGEVQLSGIPSERLQEMIKPWGAELIKFGLTDYAVIPEQANLISAQVGALIKLEALKGVAKKLGFKSVKDIPPGLAAALIGTPIVSTVDNDRKVISFQSVADSNATEGEKEAGMTSMLKFLGSMVTDVGKKLK